MGRAVVADALRSSDPAGARAAEQATPWRTRLPGALPPAGRGRARLAGGGGRRWQRAACDSLHERMRVLDQTARSTRSTSGRTPGCAGLEGVEVVGQRASRSTSWCCPTAVTGCVGTRSGAGSTRGSRPGWSSRPSPTSIEAVLDNPDWLRLEGHTVAVLGAGAEMGPLPSLMRWGARVAAVDLDRPAIWERVLGRGPGRRRNAWSCRFAADADGVVARGGRRRRPAGRRARVAALAARSSPGRSCSATTSTPTAPPTPGSRWRSTS